MPCAPVDLVESLSVLSKLVTSCTTVFIIPPSPLDPELEPSARILRSLSPSSIPTSDRPMTLVLRRLTWLTLYMGMPLRLPGVRLPVKVLGSTWRRILSNSLRSGGREETRMPTESSVADQMVRLTPSQVGSLVLWRFASSIVLKMEHTVALEGG
jgi:hypothetical protein